jgi:hypothetical protein
MKIFSDGDISSNLEPILRLLYLRQRCSRLEHFKNRKQSLSFLKRARLLVA